MEAAAAQTQQGTAPSQGAAAAWHATLARLSTRISAHVLQTWFVPTRPVSLVGLQLTLGVPSSFHADWLKDHYQDVLEEALGQELPGATLRFQVLPELEAQVAPPQAVTRAEAAARPDPVGQAITSAGANVTALPRPSTRFNPRSSFDAFVTGPSNQLAVAASRSVAEQPGHLYNPLFIFGAVGLGKTHLLHAIGQHIQATRPALNVLYLSAEDFANDLITSVQNGRMDNFRARYRAGCDVLLLDDVHFLGGKDRTQEEFFHVFNHHHQLGRQVVVTSDRFPHQMEGMEERLRNRLQWGLIVDIQAPELETRVAILRQKATQFGVVAPDDVLQFLAGHIKANVRELEGALTRLVAAASMKKLPLDLALAREELKDQVLSRARLPTCEDIQKHVGAFYNVHVGEMRGTKRNRGITLPRHMAMYLCRKHTQASFPEIGAAFGGKDHTTVMASVRKMDALIAQDPAVATQAQHLSRLLDS